jgi:enoyl-CoA hydratase/carnithine racemase
MPLARARHLWLLLAPAALAAAAWWHVRAHPAEHAAGRAAPVAAHVTQVGATAPQPRAVKEHGTALRLSYRDAVEAQPDLYRYAQQLQQQVRAGDAQAGWRLSRVYDYCAPYAASPSGYAADSAWIAAQHTPGVVAMHAARERVAQRCAGFAPTDGLSPRVVAQQRQAAARAGSLAAEAAMLALGEPLHASPGYKRTLVQRVLASRDPEAYLALAPAMGARASGDDSLQGYVAGDQFAELAWQVAACRLGLDCSADSTLVTSYCANAGICSRDSAQDFVSFVFDAAVPRQGADRVDEMVDTLVSDTGAQS